MNDDQCCDDTQDSCEPRNKGTCAGSLGTVAKRRRHPLRHNVSTTNFSEALGYLKQGVSVSRLGWNGAHYITLQNPDQLSKMGLPYIYMTVKSRDEFNGRRVPWVASHTALLACDWYIVSPEA